MTLDDFFPPSSPDLPPGDADTDVILRAAQREPRLELPCWVLHPLLRGRVAAALGLSEETLSQVLAGTHALFEGRVVAERDFDFESWDIGDFVGVEGVARALPEPGALLLRAVPIEPERQRVLTEAHLDPPPDAIEAAYFTLARAAGGVRHMVELSAPEILIRAARAHVQRAFERLVGLRRGLEPLIEWTGLDDLVVKWGGATIQASGDPPPRTPWRMPEDPGGPVDGALLSSRLLVMFPFVAVVLSMDGAVLDHFPTRALRFAGESAEHLMLVQGGGPASSTMYFSPIPYVRNIREHAWVTGPIPPELPSCVAGTVHDAKWSIVVDVRQQRGYLTAPYLIGDSGPVLCSADARYAWDGGPFVIEMATGLPVLDVRWLSQPPARSSTHEGDEEDDAEDEEEEDEVELPQPTSFARRADGSFVFVLEGRLVDGRGQPIPELPEGAEGVLDAEGARLMLMLREEIRVVEIASGESRSFKLRNLCAALIPPVVGHGVMSDGSSEESWMGLLAVFGTPAEIGRQSIERLRDALAEASWGEVKVSDDELLTIAALCSDCPRLPERVEVIRHPA